jgi:hypothetical protein
MDDPDLNPLEGSLKFRLTYQGKLLAPTGGNNRTKHKHEVRKEFHPQLRKLWEISPALSSDPAVSELTFGRSAPHPHRVDTLSKRFRRCGYDFVPLVTRSISLYCELDILFLRPDQPGVVKSGDIDNRLKTLFDALRIPRDASELGGYDTPSENERPFFCLLEDDSAITKISVETDMLLNTSNDLSQTNDAHLVITVHLHPISLDINNMAFG